MSLESHVSQGAAGTVLKLSGRLDTATAPQLSGTIAGLRENPPSVLILDLKDLEYISSAGLRCVFQLKKIMKGAEGRFVISHPSPQVKKVFDIVKAVPLKSIFTSTAELDAYLDKMQKQVGNED